MIPDLEILPLLFFTNDPYHARGPMHSLLGALTIDILIVLILAYFLVPPLGRWVKSHAKNDWHLFAGIDIFRAPTNPMWALASAGIGTLSHVILDIFTHAYNPIFWPYTDMNVSYLLFGTNFFSALSLMIPLGIIAVSLQLLYWTKPDKPKPRRREARTSSNV